MKNKTYTLNTVLTAVLAAVLVVMVVKASTRLTLPSVSLTFRPVSSSPCKTNAASSKTASKP